MNWRQVEAAVLAMATVYLGVRGTPEGTACSLEISDVTVGIDSPYGIAGRGTLVGYERDGEDHVFVLTARHVATFRDLIDKQMTLYINWFEKKLCVRSRNERWRTGPVEYDAAWMELNAEEKDELRRMGALKYVPLVVGNRGRTTAMKSGVDLVNYDQFSRAHWKEKVRAYMFFKACVEVGDLTVGRTQVAPIPHPSNSRLVKGCSSVVEVKSKRLTIPGDSGCPAFVRHVVDGKEGWGLVGIVLGGNDVDEVNGVMPLDEVARLIRSGGVRLVDRRELW